MFFKKHLEVFAKTFRSLLEHFEQLAKTRNRTTFCYGGKQLAPPSKKQLDAFREYLRKKAKRSA